MSARDDAQTVLDINYDQFGDDAFWTPAGGEEIAVRVIPDEADAIADVGGRGRRNVSRCVLNVRASEVATKAPPGVTPKIDDAIRILTTTFRIINQPNRADPLQLEWTMDCAT
jgi:hypothetical protein